MEEELRCPVCKQLYNNPVLLPCYHSLCLNCAVHLQIPASQNGTVTNVPREVVERDRDESSAASGAGSEPSSTDYQEVDKLSMLSETDSGVVCNSRPNSYVGTPNINGILFPPVATGALSLSCPICQKVVYFDENGSHNLPKYRAMQTIVDKFTEQKNMILKCQLCEGEPAQDATVMCEQCEVLYCDSCRESCHPMRGPLAKHSLLEPLQGRALLRSKTKSKDVHCAEHEDEALSMYCIVCKVPVCPLCLDSRHSSHDVQAINTMCKAQKGIEGRSKNPVSLLIDAMSHPGADMGLEWPSLLTWKKTTKSLDHVVIGKGEPGGIWHAIADNILTISPGRWMALPGLEFKEYHDKRATASEVAKYYLEYVKKNDLSSYMLSHSSVTMIQPLTSKSRKKARWKVWVTDANGSTISYECLHLVLATGSSDKAGCLGVAGESLPFVNHDLKCFEEQLSRGNKEEASSFYISGPEPVSPIKLDRHETLISPFNFQKKENDYPSALFILNDNVGPESETDLEKFSDVVKDVKSEENRLSDIDRDVYSIKLSDKSERKSFENVFTEENDIWYPNDIPGDKELELSLSVLDINSREFVCLNSWYGDLQENRKTVLVVGAGLSAADAILTAWSKNYSVFHAFRSPFISSQLPAMMYPEYHELYNLMRGLTSRKDYKPLPGHQVTEIHKDNTIQLTDSSGNHKFVKVYSVAILIGSQPDLFFLPKSLKNLGVDPNKPVDCKANPIQIEPFSYRCVQAPPGMYALGPLVGDNFVRFLQGGAIAIASHIFKDNSVRRAH